MHSLNFFYEIQIGTIFIRSFFHIMRTFDSVEPQSVSNFLFLYIIRFQTSCSLEHLAPSWGKQTSALKNCTPPKSPPPIQLGGAPLTPPPSEDFGKPTATTYFVSAHTFNNKAMDHLPNLKWDWLNALSQVYPDT